MKAILRFLALGLLAVPAFSQPQRTFVSAKNGNDANSCSLASPCRNLRRGVQAVASGGEVIALDSGGYGSLVIQKPVSISAPTGIHVGVTTSSPSEQYAIGIVTTGSVSLRGISVPNLGGWGGIYCEGGGTVRIDSCRVENGFYSGIILYAGTDAGYGFLGGTMIVTDTVVIGNASDDVTATGTDPTHRALVSLDRVRISQSGSVGVSAWGHADVSVRNSVMFNNYVGVQTITPSASAVARMTVVESVIDGNVYGVLSDPPFGSPDAGIMRISNSAITHSTMRAIWIRNGRIYTQGNNTVVGNAADEVFPDTFSTK